MNMLYLFSKMFGFVIHTIYKVQHYISGVEDLLQLVHIFVLLSIKLH